MRKRSTNEGVSVHAIAGTEVVLLGLNATPSAAKGLLGFRILKRKGKRGKPRPLEGGRDFPGVKNTLSVIQSFMWSDYVVDPKTTYTYQIVPVYGDPASPIEGSAVEATITTENPDDKVHAVYFNRGVAGSQAYSRRFGKYRRFYKDDPQVEDPGNMKFTEYLRPENVPDRAAYTWLSRGLEEAMLGFIAQAKGPEYAIRGALYELTYLPAVQAFVDAMERGADVQVVHHGKRKSTYVLKQNYDADTKVEFSDGETPSAVFKNREVLKVESADEVCSAAKETISAAGVQKEFLDEFRRMFLLRKNTTISHNKFVVLLRHGSPIQVWTGSTNFTAGGIFGQSNVGHVIRDATIAQRYLEYWEKLKTDPKKTSLKSDPPGTGMRDWTVMEQPDLEGPPPPNSMTAIFSPRKTKKMLDWYADQLAAARNSVFFTAAFSVADEILNEVRKNKQVKCDQPFLRYLMLEGIGGLLRKKYPVMAACPQNRIAWGDTLEQRGNTEELIETLTGLNDHVSYVHTKYMLVDPLSDDPLVITGSANFSEASTVNNDENMVIIRGNTRLADIFLGEFMRLFNHFHHRNRVNAMSEKEVAEYDFLAPNDKWTVPYFDKTKQEYQERRLFA